jgi:hypothetical protein
MDWVAGEVGLIAIAMESFGLQTQAGWIPVTSAG